MLCTKLLPPKNKPCPRWNRVKCTQLPSELVTPKHGKLWCSVRSRCHQVIPSRNCSDRSQWRSPYNRRLSAWARLVLTCEQTPTTFDTMIEVSAMLPVPCNTDTCIICRMILPNQFFPIYVGYTQTSNFAAWAIMWHFLFQKMQKIAATNCSAPKTWGAAWWGHYAPRKLKNRGSHRGRARE